MPDYPSQARKAQRYDAARKVLAARERAYDAARTVPARSLAYMRFAHAGIIVRYGRPSC